MQIGKLTLAISATNAVHVLSVVAKFSWPTTIHKNNKRLL